MNFFWKLLSLLLVSGVIALDTAPFAQSCEINFPTNTNDAIRTKSYRTIVQSSTNAQEWQGLENGIISDDKYITTQLGPNENSELLSFSNFGLRIPEGSMIYGISVYVEGKSEDESATDVNVNLLYGGSSSTYNGAQNEFFGTAWSEQKSLWRYGAGWFDWNLSLSAQQINNANFGFQIQIKNTHNQSLTAQIDRVYIEVNYKPPYSVCLDHACIIASVPELAGVGTYTWDIPNDFVAISQSEDENVIVIAPVDPEIGTFELCVTPNGTNQTCCSYFTMEDCRLGSIGDYVWEDRNINGIQEFGEPGIEGVVIYLFDVSGKLIEQTTTDQNGFYLFENLESEEYFIQLVGLEDYLPTSANVGNDNLDSDLNEILGALTSDYVFVNPGENITSLDVGLLKLNDISGTLWNDKNANGIRDLSESLLSGVEVSVLNANGVLVQSTVTGNDGMYLFEDLINDQYSVVVSMPNEFLISPIDQGQDDNIDSDFNADGIYFVNFLDQDLTLDAGVFQYGSINGFTWLDLNRDGLISSDEEGMENIQINLIDQNGSVYYSTNLANGFYSIPNITPGNYVLELTTTSDFLQTTDSDDHNLLLENNNKFIYEIVICSGDEVVDLNFGFQYKPSSIAGFTWLDSNGDGLFVMDVIISGIEVNLFDSNDNLITSQITNASGNYIFENLNPGDYYVMFEKPSHLNFTQLGDSDVTNAMGSGATNVFSLMPDQDLTDVNAGYFEFASIGDYVWLDLDRDGIQDPDENGLENIVVRLVDNVNFTFEFDTTDANGFYEFDQLIPSNHSILVHNEDELIPSPADQGNGNNDSRPVIDQGPYYTYSGIDVLSGMDINNIDFGFQYKPSSIEGFAWVDPNANGIFESEDLIQGIEVSLFSESGVLIASQITDQNGAYIFELLNPGNYYLVFGNFEDYVFTTSDNDSQVTNLITLGSTDLIALGVDQAIKNINAGYYQFATIGDYLWLDENRDGIQGNNEIGLSGVEISLINSLTNQSISVFTNNNGFYNFQQIVPGTYYIQLEKDPQYIATEPEVGNGQNDSRSLNMSGSNYQSSEFTISSGDGRNDLDFGFQFTPSSISGLTWLDNDASSTNDSEDGLAGIDVELYNSSGNLVGNTVTDFLGYYDFQELNPGDYYVIFELPQDYNFSDFAADADVSSSIILGSTNLISLTTDQDLTGVDAGYYQFASVGNYVWIDLNKNGIQNSAESGLSNSVVTLRNVSSGSVQNSTLDNNGNYLFDDLIPGEYEILLPKNSNLSPTISNSGNGNNDSRTLIDDGNQYRSEAFILTSGMMTNNQDFGFEFLFGSISGIAWEDLNADGFLNSNESGKADVNVLLFDQTGTQLAMTSSSSNGQYSFTDVIPGEYYVVFELSPDELYAPSGNDSNVTGANGVGSTDQFSVLPSQNVNSVNSGCYRFAEIGNYVWLDLNQNGIQGSLEMGIPNFAIKLNNLNTGMVTSTTTNDEGLYGFDNLLPGEYQISLNKFPNLQATVANAGTGFNDSRGLNDAGNQYESETFSLVSGQSLQNRDFGFGFLFGSISGMAFVDVNADGIFDANDQLKSGLTVELYGASGALVQSTFTNANGMYTFSDVIPSDYYVVFELEADEQVSPSGNDSNISNANGTGSTDLFAVAPSQTVENIDGGCFKYASIGDYIWLDLNENGIQGPLEMGLGQVEVVLRNLNTGAASTSTSNGMGFYQFADLLPGDYQIEIEKITNYQATIANVGNGNNDSRILNEVGNIYESEMFTLISGQDQQNWDFGFQFLFGSISGQAFIDNNADGIMDNSDDPKSDIEVELFDQNDQLVKSTSTNQNGQYVFMNVVPGDYYVVFNLDGNDQISPLGNDSDISDANGTGSTDLFNIAASQNLMSIDGGCYRFGSVGDYVWLDTNANGIQNASENGIQGLMITLINANTGMQQNALTDASGMYIFDNLVPGNYSLSLTKNPELEPSIPNAGNGNNDSRDLMDAGAFYASNDFNLTSGQQRDNLDFGFKELSSSISGVVWNDFNADGFFTMNESVRPNVMVQLFDVSGSLVATTDTNANGTYIFDGLTSGQYYIVFENSSNLIFSPQGFESAVTNDVVTGSTDIISLMPDQSLTNINAGLYGFSQIGDYVWLDENGDGIQDSNEMGIEGVVVSLFDDGGIMIDQQTTNSSGQYQFDMLLTGDYYIIFDAIAGNIPTIANAGNGSNDSDIEEVFGPGSTNIFTLAYLDNNEDIDAGFQVVNGSISGMVFIDGDANGLNEMMDTPYPGVVVELYDSNDVLVDQATSNANGEYVFDQLPSGVYYVEFEVPSSFNVTLPNVGNDDAIDSDVNNANGLNTTSNINLPAQGAITNVDLGIFQYVTIGDQVWVDSNGDGLNNNNENGLIGVSVTLINQNGSPVAITATDALGNYMFINQVPGIYQIRFDMPDDYQFTASNVGMDESIDSDADNNAGNLGFTNPFMLASGMSTVDIDAGVVFMGSGLISGMVWRDFNADGIQVAGESMLEGIGVQLFDISGMLIESTATDPDGVYVFDDVEPGDYYVEFSPGLEQIFSPADIGMDDTADSDVTELNGPGTTDVISIVSNDVFTNVNAGLFRYGSIGDRVWIDANQNGIQDMIESGLNGVTVQLIDNNGMQVANTITQNNGNSAGFYSFMDVVPNTYTLVFTTPAGYEFTIQDAGTNDNVDSDVFQTASITSAVAPFNLTSGLNITNIDAGVIEEDEISLSGFAFHDVNGNGLKDTGDIYLNGTTVNLFTTDGVLVGSQMTNTDSNGNDGFYNFPNVAPDMYYVEFEFPNGAVSTLVNQGSNDLLESDANGLYTTDDLDLNNGSIAAVCGAYYFYGTIGDFAWSDLDGNGIQDATEPGTNDVMVRLFTASGSMVDINFTTNDAQGNPGYYSFFNVPPGEYYLRFSASGSDFSDADQGADDELDSDVTGSNGTGTTDDFDLMSGQMIDNIDAGIQLDPSEVGDYCWVDFNGDGIQDPSEPGLENVVIELYDENDVLIATTMSDVNGFYNFGNLASGNYYILFTPPMGYMPSDADQGGDDTLDSDIMGIIAPFATNIFNLAPGEADTDMDAGFFLPSRIGDFVWDDLNKDGIQDANEPGIEGVKVDLRLGTFFVLETTTTDANGFFEFNSLKQGTYSLRFYDLPPGYIHSAMDQGTDDMIDSDPNPSTGETALIVLAHNVDFMDLDAGIHDPSTLLAARDVLLTAFPQPASDQFTVEMDMGLDTEVQWKLINPLGVKVKEGFEGAFKMGQHTFTVDVSDLTAGTYFIKIGFDGFYKIRKIIVD